ncbi:hypothetical protein GCM10009092_44000 [Bowmanella denitrificans]|uniref:Uncharacterized protein n=1 Tax=Bowmanella denitrificans TaxID=366582 RepID=A0ABN0XWL0_9ALTE
MKNRAMLIVNSTLTLIAALLLILSKPAYSQISKAGYLEVKAEGNESRDGFVYSAMLSPQGQNSLPIFQPGDEVTVTVSHDTPIEIVVWTQHWEKYAGKKCKGGGLFSKRKCKKTYHHSYPEDKHLKKPSNGWNIKIGLQGLPDGAKCTAQDPVLKPQTTLNQKLIVNYPARLCIVGGGSIKRPSSIPGDGSAKSEVTLLRSIKTTEFQLWYEVKRKYVKEN